MPSGQYEFNFCRSALNAECRRALEMRILSVRLSVSQTRDLVGKSDEQGNENKGRGKRRI